MKVVIFGLGAIGSNLFTYLVRQFPEWEYTGIDFDKVEDRNLRTQAYFKEHVGQFKSSALLAVGSRFVQKLKYTQIRTKVDKSFKLYDRDKDILYIDCFDNSESRKLLTELAKSNGLHMLHLGFSPLYSAEAIWNENYDVPNDVDATQPDICSMVDAIGFIQTFIGLTLLNISDWSRTGVKKNFIITNKTKLTNL